MQQIDAPPPASPDDVHALMSRLKRRQRLLLALVAARLTLNVWEKWAVAQDTRIQKAPRRALELAALHLDARVPSEAVDTQTARIQDAAGLAPGNPETDIPPHPVYCAAWSAFCAAGMGHINDTVDDGPLVNAPTTAVIMAAMATMDPADFHDNADSATVQATWFEQFFARWWQVCRDVKAR